MPEWRAPCCAGQVNNIVISNDKGRMNQEEVERLVEEAKTYAEEDEMNRKRVEARNALENYSYSCRSAVRDSSSPGAVALPAEDKVGRCRFTPG